MLAYGLFTTCSPAQRKYSLILCNSKKGCGTIYNILHLHILQSFSFFFRPKKKKKCAALVYMLYSMLATAALMIHQCYRLNVLDLFVSFRTVCCSFFVGPKIKQQNEMTEIFSFSASMVDWTKNHQMSPTLSKYLFAFKRVMHKYIFSFVSLHVLHDLS